MALAEDTNHPYSLANALFYIALIAQYHRDAESVQHYAKRLEALSSAQGLPIYMANGQICEGWAIVEQGHVTEGLNRIQQGLSTLQAIGQSLDMPYYLALQAQAWGKMRQPEKATSQIMDALSIVANTGERWFEAELYRLKAEFHLEQPHAYGSKVEADFQQALEIARGQQAKSWELRAAMGLSRFWLQQGKRTEAKRLLKARYDGFMEGFDTADLREARQLLAML